MKMKPFTRFDDEDDDGDNGYDQEWLDEIAGEKNSEWSEF